MPLRSIRKMSREVLDVAAKTRKFPSGDQSIWCTLSESPLITSGPASGRTLVPSTFTVQIVLNTVGPTVSSRMTAMDFVRQKLVDRGESPPIEEIVQLDAGRRALVHEGDELRAKRNEVMGAG